MPEQKLQVTEEKGNLFDAPANVLLVHACNCKGSWDTGIAKQFKDKYPRAYTAYNNNCKRNGYKLLGKSQVTLDTVTPLTASLITADQLGDAQIDYFIGNLFTSYSFGKYKDRKEVVLKLTKSAFEDLLIRVYDWNKDAKSMHKIQEVRMCKINSGLFKIPWEETKKVLENIDVSQSTIKVVKVVSLI